ncbi:MAG: rod shape-determining protein MreC [Flavobacteriaceae bacterium]|nr:rod shape-determining protein MreC [Flavobacteriaceae bacterium]
MQRIINTIIRFKNFFVFIFLLIVSLSFSYTRSDFHENKINNFSLIISSNFYKPFYNLKSYLQLRELNEKLMEENILLKKEKLNKKLDSKYENNYDLILAKVIKNSTKLTRNNLIINKGKKNGIKRDMGVISKDGIVGIINETSKNYSSVISILNKDLKINAKHNKSNAYGSLEWNQKDPTVVELNDISIDNEIFIGDTISTGGMSFYFPNNIPIGEINSIKISENNGFYSLKVKLFQKMNNISYVYVIENFNYGELYEIDKNNFK